MHSLYGLGATAGGGASVAELQAAAAAAALATTTDVSGSKDTTLTKIFVGGLPYHTSDKTLHEYFEQFGEIEEAVVITDRQTQKSRGYGFVTMKDRPAAERACKDPNPIIDGRKANVNLAYLGAKPRGNMQLAGMTSEPQWPLAAALGGGIQQLPLQTQLQALFPQRLGMPQLFMPQQAFMNPLLGLGGAQSHQIMDYSQALAAAMAAQNGASAGGASAAAAHAAALNQNAAAAALFQHAGVPVSSAAGSLDPYAAAAAAYNPYAAFQGGFPLQSAQLAAASAAAAAAEHQRV